MAVAAAQKNREMFAIKKSYSIEVSLVFFLIKIIIKIARELKRNVVKFVRVSGASVCRYVLVIKRRALPYYE